MLLTIDVGNTRIKAAVFEQNTLEELFIFTQEFAPANYGRAGKDRK